MAYKLIVLTEINRLKNGFFREDWSEYYLKKEELEINNIPGKNFKVVRYYGMYANTLYESSKLAVSQLNSDSMSCFPDGLIQVPLREVPLNGPPRCDGCGALMNLVLVEFCYALPTSRLLS